MIVLLAVAAYVAFVLLVAAACGTNTRRESGPLDGEVSSLPSGDRGARPSTGDKALDDWIAYRGRSFG